MALATERIKFLVDVDTSAFVKGMRSMADQIADLSQSGDRIALLDAVGDAALATAKKYYGVLQDTVRATSDLAEATNFSQKVFREAAPDIEKFAESASKIGFSKTAALNAAAALGVFGRTAGYAGDDLVKFTTDLVQLAADMASVKNTTPQDAIIALGAALRSEYEPLRKYGVVLNDAQLRQKAFELGIYRGIGALNSSQRILAARAEVMEQLSFAQGDFVDTSDQLANSQRILAAEVENLKTSIGQGLLPVFKGATQAASGLVSLFDALPDSVKSATGSIAILSVGLIGLVGVALKLRAAFLALSTAMQGSALGSMAASLAGPAGLAVAIAGVTIAIPAMITAFADARKESKLTEQALRELDEVFTELGKGATEGETLEAFMKKNLEGTIDVIGKNAKGAPAEMKQSIETALTAALGTLTDFNTAVTQSLDMTDKEFDAFFGGMRQELIRVQAPVTLLKWFDEFIGKLRAARPELKATFEQYQAELAQTSLQEEEYIKQLKREEEQLIKTRQAALKDDRSATRDVFLAQLGLLKAIDDAQKKYQQDLDRYNQSLIDQEQALERQRRGVEDSQRSIEDAQRGVSEALRAEAKAREGIDRAIRDQVDAQERLVDAQEEAASAQVEYEKAVRDAAGALRGYGAASKEAADALENLDDAQRRLRGSQLSLEDSSISLSDAQVQLDRLRRFYGNTNSPSALRRLADAERAVARAKLEHENAVDDLESSTKDAADAQDEYNWTVNGFPPESDRAKDAMERQKDAAKNLETALKQVDGANRALVDSQRAVDEARYNADQAARAVEEANWRVQRAVQDAQWATDDLRRAEWELATYRQSGQPTYASDSVMSAEWALEQAKRDAIAATMELLAAEQALAAFRLQNQSVLSRNQTTNLAPGFMNGAPPAGSNFGSSVTTVNLNVSGFADPITTGKYIAEQLQKYLIATGQVNPYATRWF